MSNIFDTFIPQLLSDPNADDPFNADAAGLCKFKCDIGVRCDKNLDVNDRADYYNHVVEYVKKYACKKLSKGSSDDKSDDSDSDSSMSEFDDESGDNDFDMLNTRNAAVILY